MEQIQWSPCNSEEPFQAWSFNCRCYKMSKKSDQEVMIKEEAESKAVYVAKWQLLSLKVFK